MKEQTALKPEVPKNPFFFFFFFSGQSTHWVARQSKAFRDTTMRAPCQTSKIMSREGLVGGV